MISLLRIPRVEQLPVEYYKPGWSIADGMLQVVEATSRNHAAAQVHISTFKLWVERFDELVNESGVILYKTLERGTRTLRAV